MFKIPDDSDNEDDIPTKSYFKDRKTVSLNETVRNHGVIICDQEASNSSTTAKQRKSTLPDASAAHASAAHASAAHASAAHASAAHASAAHANICEGSDKRNTIRASEERKTSASQHKLPRQPQTSLSKAFAFMRETEYYDNQAVEKITEENRKRKLEETSKKAPRSEQTSDQTKHPRKQEQASSSAVIVSTRQRGNPILAHMRNVVVTYSDTILPDYVMGACNCALFLSLKYHRLHPNYIYERLRQLGQGYTVRVLLVLVDIPDSAVCVQELTKVALLSSVTLFLAWSTVEAARYLEAFKIYEKKPAEVLQGFKDTSYQGHLTSFLTSIRGVNKTDVNRLKAEFGTVKEVMGAEKKQLSTVPGIGDKKASRIHELFRQPFKNNRE